MIVKRNFNFIILFVLFLGNMHAQVHAGKIVYERKTNLYKKFKGDNPKDWIDERDKNKIDVFELYFNDTASVFKPKVSEEKERMAWATGKNHVYQNFNSGMRLTAKDIWGEEVFLKDSIAKRQWKITDSKRSIAGFMCRKAIWKVNDSLRIYAWYADEIIPSVGPESFGGLPGAILGLATEDGGVIYFAKTIEFNSLDIVPHIPKTGKAKIYNTTELRKRFEKEFGNERWGKAMIRETFDIW